MVNRTDESLMDSEQVVAGPREEGERPLWRERFPNAEDAYETQ